MLEARRSAEAGEVRRLEGRLAAEAAHLSAAEAGRLQEQLADARFRWARRSSGGLGLRALLLLSLVRELPHPAPASSPGPRVCQAAQAGANAAVPPPGQLMDRRRRRRCCRRLGVLEKRAAEASSIQAEKAAALEARLRADPRLGEAVRARLV